MRSIHFWIKGSFSQFSLSTITNHFVSLRLRVFTQILEDDSLWGNHLPSLLPLHFFSPPLSSCIAALPHRTSIVVVFVVAPTTADLMFDCVCSRTLHLHRIVSRAPNLCSRVSDRLPSLSGKSIFTMSSHNKKSDSAFSTPFGGVEVDTTSSLILGATGDVWYFPKITPSDSNSNRAQMSELSMATAHLNLAFPCCWESNLDDRPDIVARLRSVDAMFTTFVSKFPQKLPRDYQSAWEDVKVLLKPIVVLSSPNEGHMMYFCTLQQYTVIRDRLKTQL